MSGYLDPLQAADAASAEYRGSSAKTECEPGWIQTYSGGRFYPAAPKVEHIGIFDIAHALSNVCRYTGHCESFYSVAEHSVRVAMMVPPEYRLQGLLHDASEAYLADIPRPLKQLPEFAPYRAMEALVQQAVWDRFAVVPTTASNHAVHDADLLMLATEAAALMPRREIREWAWLPPPIPGPFDMPWSPVMARGKFLLLFHELYPPGQK